MKRVIRILHVLGRLDYGGAETMIINLYHNIDRTKVQFDFVIHTNDICDYENEVLKLGGKIFRIPRYLGNNHFVYKKAWCEFFDNHPNYKVIHGHVRSTAMIYLRIAKKRGLITIAHSHSVASRGSKLEQLIKSVYQYPIRYQADYLFACSEEAGKWLYGKNIIKKDNYMILKNAIDTKKFSFDISIRKRIRKELGIKNEYVIGHVGSFTYPKNHKFILKIFNEIQKINRDSILLLIGEGELNEYINEQIKIFGIKDKVILTGAVSNVNEYMMAMDIFLFPSIYEGLSLAIIEAQTSGINCIISDTIPKEVNITNLVTRVSLKKSILIWSEQVLKYYKGFQDDNRNNMYEEIKNAQYDIVDNSKWLQEFYDDLCKKYM